MTDDLAARGFVRLGPLLAGADLEAVRAAADRTLARAPQGPHGAIRHDAWRREPALEAAVARVAAWARALLGVPAVRLFQDHVICKPPGTPGEVAWHQDYGYWPLASPRGLTVWVALDDADEANGCLRYAPGSHHLGERRPADFVAGAHQPDRPDLPPLDPREAPAPPEAALARAGEALAHDPLVWHTSGPNASTRVRRAWSISLVLPDARWDPGHAPHPYVASLRPTPGAPLDPSQFPVFPPSSPESQPER
ncbi:MAG: phytanoyl-CoA dioxygenase family protein [Planctomycetes bacterium]|nr:phytanoyl-CoA dioxygenase family protein [Planctomycetota bacterium]